MPFGRQVLHQVHVIALGLSKWHHILLSKSRKERQVYFSFTVKLRFDHTVKVWIQVAKFECILCVLWHNTGRNYGMGLILVLQWNCSIFLGCIAITNSDTHCRLSPLLLSVFGEIPRMIHAGHCYAEKQRKFWDNVNSFWLVLLSHWWKADISLYFCKVTSVSPESGELPGFR